MTGASVTDLPPVFDGIEAVCFDAFGTLVEITEKRNAYMPLFRALPADQRREFKHRLMREDRLFTDWPKALGVEMDAYVLTYALLEVLELSIIESQSIALRSGMAEIWTKLRSEGLRLAVCSNLASDYVAAMRQQLPDRPDVEVLSCKIGAIKPEPAIYAAVLDGLQLDPGRILFVGDTPRADIKGPQAAGMKALHVDELVRMMGRGCRS